MTVLGSVIGKYNSHLDIDPEDHRKLRRPKDKIPCILIGIYLIVPTKLSFLKRILMILHSSVTSQYLKKY